MIALHSSQFLGHEVCLIPEGVWSISELFELMMEVIDHYLLVSPRISLKFNVHSVVVLAPL